MKPVPDFSDKKWDTRRGEKNKSWFRNNSFWYNYNWKWDEGEKDERVFEWTLILLLESEQIKECQILEQKIYQIVLDWRWDPDHYIIVSFKLLIDCPFCA